MQRIKSPRHFIDLIETAQLARSVIAAVKLGVFDRLSEQPSSIPTLSGELGVPVRGLRKLLQLLNGIGLIEVNIDEIASLTNEGRQVLGTPKSMSNWTLHQGTLYSIWDELEQNLRSGQPVLSDTHDIDVRAYALGLAEIYSFDAVKLHDVVDFKGPLHVLDAGGGAGHYLVEPALINGSLTGVVVDRSDVTPITREYVESRDLHDRVRVQNCDLLTEQWPVNFDLVILANVIHGKSLEDSNLLLDKAYSSLNSGGRVVISEWRYSPSEHSALFDMTMHLCTPQGSVYTTSDLVAMLERATFGSIYHEEYGNDRVAIVGTK